MSSSEAVKPVEIISRHNIKSANEASLNTIESPFRSGPFETLVSPSIPVAVVFVYEKPSTPLDVELIPVQRLQHALALLLDHYPQLTGRLSIGSDGTPEIDRLGSGVEVVEARCSSRLDAFASPSLSPGHILLEQLPGAGNDLLAPFDPKLESVCSDPIFTIQHTRFACGGVALGARLLHVVGDADGFFQVMRDLAELYRGILSTDGNGRSTFDAPSLTNPPHIRCFMSEYSGGNMTLEDRRAALKFKPSMLFVRQPVVNGADPPMPTFIEPPSPAEGRLLRFSSSELNALKADGTDPNGSGWVSTFDALCAHLHQSVYRARVQLRALNASIGELTSADFLAPVNLRTQLDLPSYYFPLALFTPSTSFPLDVLSKGPLSQVAKAIHDLMRTSFTTSKDEILATLKWIAAQPDKTKIRTTFQYGPGSLMISQWNKFDIYPSMAFDKVPVLVAPPFTPISTLDGLGYLLPTEEQGTEGDSGAIDLYLSLSQPLWAILDQDEGFRKYKTAP